MLIFLILKINSLISFPVVLLKVSYSDFLRLNFKPNSIELIGPEIIINRSLSGDLNFNVKGSDDYSANLASLLLSYFSQPNLVNTNRLTQLQITKANILFNDSNSGEAFEATDVEINIKSDLDQIYGNIDLNIIFGDLKIPLNGLANYKINDTEVKIITKFEDLNFSKISNSTNIFGWMKGLNLPLSGEIASIISLNGKILDVQYDLYSSKGLVTFPNIWSDSQVIDELHATGGFFSDNFKSIRIDNLQVKSGLTSAKFSGEIAYDEKGRDISLEGTFDNLSTLYANKIWPKSISPNIHSWFSNRVQSGLIRNGSIKLRLDSERLNQVPLSQEEVQLMFEYEEVEVLAFKDQPPFNLGNGQVKFTGSNFEISAVKGNIGNLEISEAKLSIDEINNLSNLASIDLVATGSVKDFFNFFSLPPFEINQLPPEIDGNAAIRANFILPLGEDSSIKKLSYAAAANITQLKFPKFYKGFDLSDGNFEIIIDNSTVNAEGNASINGTSVKVAINHLIDSNVNHPTSGIIEGEFNNNQVNSFGLDVMNTSKKIPFSIEFIGSATDVKDIFINLELTSIGLDLPEVNLRKSPGDQAFGYFHLAPSNNSIKVPSFSFSSKSINANGELLFFPEEKNVFGNVDINQVSFGFEWDQIPSEISSEINSRLKITAELGDKERKLIGYPIGEWISGPISLNLDLLANGLIPQEYNFNIDFSHAEIVTPIWNKPSSVDGVIKISLIKDLIGGSQINSFALSSGGLVASGTFAVKSDDSLKIENINIARLIVGETTLTGDVIIDSQNNIQVVVQGGILDSRPFLSEMLNSSHNEFIPKINFSGRFDKFIFSERLVLSDFIAKGDYLSGELRNFLSTSVLPGGALLKTEISQQKNNYFISLNSNDAGEFFEDLGFFQGASGGYLDIQARYNTLPEQNILEGRALVDSFHLERAPVLAQIFSLASLGGLNDALQGQGISFIGFDAPFKYQANEFDLIQARAWGPALGITIDGDFNQRANSMNLSGTLVPAYTINRVLGAIPILGDLLVGEGVFAISYRLDGDAGQPLITVNPLTALTPAFLRGMIFGFEGE